VLPHVMHIAVLLVTLSSVPHAFLCVLRDSVFTFKGAIWPEPLTAFHTHVESCLGDSWVPSRQENARCK
jgi:hypothetical protein